MDIYSRKSRWKIYLALAGLLIVGISLWYTQYLAGQLREQERAQVEQLAMAQRMLAGEAALDPNRNFELELAITTSNKTIPMIWVDETDVIIEGANFGEVKNQDKEFLQKELNRLKARGTEPVEIKTKYFTQYIFYKDSWSLQLLTYFPYLQFGLISVFLAFGYWAFSSSRRAEQNRVWVGMAKEAAHQLGTPITAIIAWIEHLKASAEGDENMEMIAEELQKDVDRLGLVAERFSKIGAAPKLKPYNLREVLFKNFNYMKIRAPRKVTFEFLDGNSDSPLMGSINESLFSWVIENLLKNALDALEGKGEIRAAISEDKKYINIDISDTGKGIPSSRFRTIFEPGYSTKKRGWGLGLSLTKRIIETYHSGRIFVKESGINKGTTFRIQLPKLQIIDNQ